MVSANNLRSHVPCWQRPRLFHSPTQAAPCSAATAQFVFDIAWGRDIAADFDHITTNISLGPGGDPAIDFFHTSDVALLRDEKTCEILYTPTRPGVSGGGR